MRDWKQTMPPNHHPAMGHVDWIGETGYPLRATLHGDGKWSCTIAELAKLFDVFHAPADGVDVSSELGALRDLQEKVNGVLTLVDIDLAMPRVPDGKKGGKNVVF